MKGKKEYNKIYELDGGKEGKKEETREKEEKKRINLSV
jgi:hypothetical protein